jgi:hypothetical protein
VTAPVQRKLRGTPIPREQLIAEWEDLRRRKAVKGPAASFLVDLALLGAGTTYQWRRLRPPQYQQMIAEALKQGRGQQGALDHQQPLPACRGAGHQDRPGCGHTAVPTRLFAHRPGHRQMGTPRWPTDRLLYAVHRRPCRHPDADQAP